MKIEKRKPQGLPCRGLNVKEKEVFSKRNENMEPRYLGQDVHCQPNQKQS